jgi:hypothetical protein
MKRGGELEILEQLTLVDLPRGSERLRLVHTLAKGPRGPIEWWSLRLFWQDQDGEWKPSRTGITIRRGELASIVEGLRAATAAPATEGAGAAT